MKDILKLIIADIVIPTLMIFTLLFMAYKAGKQSAYVEMLQTITERDATKELIDHENMIDENMDHIPRVD